MTDGSQSNDFNSVDGPSGVCEVFLRCSEGFPMYVTGGGGDSPKMTVTSTSEESCSGLLPSSRCSALGSTAVSGRSGWTTAIGCEEDFVSGVAEKENGEVSLHRQYEVRFGTKLVVQLVIRLRLVLTPDIDSS